MYFYVIMPVGADPQFAGKKAIIDALARNEDFEPHFPFGKSENIGFNINSTLAVLQDSEFVLADLSLERPSCYFELGLAQALGKEVYLIAKQGTDIHQAHGRHLTRFYSDLGTYERAVAEVLNEARTTIEALSQV